MTILSPSQSKLVGLISTSISHGGQFCLVSSNPGYGMTTCLNEVRLRMESPFVLIADHPHLAGQDLIGQMYHSLRLDAEFRLSNGFPDLAVELLSIREISTIFIDDIDIFLIGNRAVTQALKQLVWLLTALPSTTFVVSCQSSSLCKLLDLTSGSCRPHAKLELGGFTSFQEYKSFFEIVLANQSSQEARKVSLRALYLETQGNLGDTFLRLFHPAYWSRSYY